MVLAEILIDGVFVAALLTGVLCLGYVLYATILERRLRRSRRSPGRANVPLTVSSAPSALPSRAAEWRRSLRSLAFPEGKS